MVFFHVLSSHSPSILCEILFTSGNIYIFHCLLLLKPFHFITSLSFTLFRHSSFSASISYFCQKPFNSFIVQYRIHNSKVLRLQMACWIFDVSPNMIFSFAFPESFHDFTNSNLFRSFHLESLHSSNQ